MQRRLLALALALSPAALGAQRITGQVVLPDSTTPARGIIVAAADERGAPLASTLTSERGDFALDVRRAGPVVVRALRVGFRPTILPTLTLQPGETRRLHIVLNGAAVSLAAVRVRGETSCRIRQDSGQLIASLWDEAGKALTATRLSTSRGRLFTTWAVFDTVTDAGGNVVISGTETAKAGYSDRPFESIGADSLARFGYVVEEPGGAYVYNGPDADVLLSDSFAERHCFRVEPPPKDRPEWVGIGITPARGSRTPTDIQGTLWLDRESSELRRLDYRYTGLRRELLDAEAGGTIEFLRLSTGHWLVNRWVIRMPRLAIEREYDLAQRRNPAAATGVQRVVVRAIQATGGLVTAVKVAGATIYTTGDTPVESAATASRAPLSSAAVCGDAAVSERHSMLHGVVLDSDQKPVAGIKVEVSWRTDSYQAPASSTGIVAGWRTAKRETTTAEQGWWFMCGVPQARQVTVRVERDGLYTELDVVVPEKRPAAKVDLVLQPRPGAVAKQP